MAELLHQQRSAGLVDVGPVAVELLLLNGRRPLLGTAVQLERQVLGVRNVGVGLVHFVHTIYY